MKTVMEEVRKAFKVSRNGRVFDENFLMAVAGSMLAVRPGEKAPIDGIIVEGDFN